MKPKQTESKKKAHEQKLEAHFEGLLEPGESLRGVCAASQQKNLFSQAVVAFATTDRRLIVQTLDRKANPKSGEFISLQPEELASVDVGGLNAFDSPSSALMSKSTIKLKIKTKGGEKLKFMLLDGSGIFGSFGGGEMQVQGVEALMGFFGESGNSI